MKSKNASFRNFTPTKFSTAADKEKFANQFVRFVESGFKETLFPKWFYQRLSNTFGHIAHHNQGVFYSVWFSRKERQRDFLERILNWGCFGDPAFTYSDVEATLQLWLAQSGLLEKLKDEIHANNRQRELAELKRLMEKYPGQVDQITWDTFAKAMKEQQHG